MEENKMHGKICIKCKKPMGNSLFQMESFDDKIYPIHKHCWDDCQPATITQILEKYDNEHINKINKKRYVKFEFFGYAPVDLAIQLHLLGKKCDVNTVGEDMKPYTECKEEYAHLN